MKKSSKYRILGFVVARVVLPIVKREMRKKARQKFTASSGVSAKANQQHSGSGASAAKKGVLIGAVAGGAAWLLTKRKKSSSDQ